MVKPSMFLGAMPFWCWLSALFRWRFVPCWYVMVLTSSRFDTRSSRCAHLWVTRQAACVSCSQYWPDTGRDAEREDMIRPSPFNCTCNSPYASIHQRDKTGHPHRPQVKARQIWGDTVYTADSDLVAVLMHMGFYAHYLSHPPNTVAEFRALLKLLPPQEKYNSRARFVKSRLWCSPGDGCSYQVSSTQHPGPHDAHSRRWQPARSKANQGAARAPRSHRSACATQPHVLI
jgi:hypothetical protein